QRGLETARSGSRSYAAEAQRDAGEAASTFQARTSETKSTSAGSLVRNRVLRWQCFRRTHQNRGTLFSWPNHRTLARSGGTLSPHCLMSSLAEQFARYAEQLSFADLPREVVHEVKRRVIDSLACAYGAFQDEPCV